MKNHLTLKLELTDMIWAAEPRNVLRVVRAYCPFINTGELASDLTEKALMIDQAYKNGAPANELDAQMLSLKQRATGLTVTDARGMGFIPDYQETLKELPYFRAAVGVDVLAKEESSYE
ncbi:hypothetical protein I6Z03_004627 [Vibrio parahaemolyticus]|jgi:hypothetical protein|nr:hypothetical protein [Vibrio parahaemolyticus]EGQ8535972.1 hypothetical protein [Vibrio parahaemolyticus]MBE3700965.1 hypothetical protein [Vibrio parahaemolyticus]MBE3780246.1 hypothetical protein [Vibrio parahaemolyticus]MBE4263367.1 hypothetical protein [Vibrio parahaemolyticus]